MERPSMTRESGGSHNRAFASSHPLFTMHRYYFLILALFSTFHGYGQDVVKVSLVPAPGMDRAEIYYTKADHSPSAILILCPGHNSNGEWLLHDPVWQEFAKGQNLGLVALSFSSPDVSPEKRTGYYYASQGSGELLLQGLRQIYGRDLPLLLFGFSGGAQFTSRFTEWKPEQILSWCAYSAGWWDIPRSASCNPPGLVVCGEQDPRMEASLDYFQQGRTLGKPWCWLEIPQNGHAIAAPVVVFVRDYFDFMLKQRQEKSGTGPSGVLIDLDRGHQIAENLLDPRFTGWLPDISLLRSWRQLCYNLQ